MALKQCKACPWKKSTVASKDIPDGYCDTKHRNLRSTIATPAELITGPIRAFACHETPVGREKPCAGWAANQLGPGNNLALRWRARSDPDLQDIRLDGKQHETFEDTLT